MKNKKIELNILFLILIESIFFLFFFHESLLNIILGSLLALILIFMYQKLRLKENLITKASLLIILLILGTLVLQRSTNFVEYNILKNYPSLVIKLLFLFISFFLASKGYHSFIKSLEISGYLIIFLYLSSLLLVIPNIEFNNFNIQLIEELRINNHFLHFALIIFLIYVMINYLNKHQLNIKGYSISIINSCFFKVITIGILGKTLTDLYQYPYINILKRIKYLDFIERMEGILSFQYLFIFFFLLAFILLTIRYLIMDIFKRKNDKTTNIILAVLSLLIFILSINI